MKITGFYIRDAEEKIYQKLKAGYITVVLGARQTGKTTLMKKIQAEIAGKSFYFLLDSIDVSAKMKDDFYFFQKEIEARIGTTIVKYQGVISVFFDEAQKVPQVFELVKIWHDTFPQKFQIILSGSSSLEIQKNSSESLAGRATYVYLHPLSIKELIMAKLHIKLPSLFTNLGTITMEILRQMQAQVYSQKGEIDLLEKNIITSGLLPGIWAREDSQKSMYLQSIIELYLEKDIRALGLVRELTNFNNLLKILSAEIGSLTNILEFSRSIGVSYQTIKAHLSILENTFVMHFLPPYVSARERAVKSQKLYFFDIGVPNYITRRLLPENVFDSQAFGGIWENIFLPSLISYSQNEPASWQLYFWRNYAGREIDLIAQLGEIIIPIEITHSTSVSQRKIQNLNAFFEKRKETKFGIVLYSGILSEIKITRRLVYLIPWWMWW